ncbi:ribosomal oxygenase 1 [Agrilus planipennis]|uniref:Bifunctional lysine-specific demethylase and histidyl-hydroxylase n=1 Tax=Agrilus planipennis TaxID=224129 RepID=A0A1W4XCZ7_AGRPL|nr:ribosomal oxygenase 1 [Agrilus planipennis]
MSEPQSAFAVYKQQLKSQTKKKHKPKKSSQKIKNKALIVEKRDSVTMEADGNSGSDEDIPQLVPIEDSWIESSFIQENGGIQKKENGVTSRKRSLKHKSKSKPQKKKKKTFSNGEHNYISKSSEISTNHTNFDEKAKTIFEWLIAPIKASDFFETYWEKKPLIIKRGSNIYRHILSTEQLDLMLRENSLFFTKNVDVVQYKDGKKENFNTEGRAYASNLWSFYSDGCSIRILNPHTYNSKIHQLLAALQEYFGTMAGANIYLTPPGSQGFAPHYDDIEAFVIQLEGRKHWKLYGPRNSSDILPRYSSENFDPKDLTSPVKEITLEAGDLLYFPRGVIHEGHTDDDSHSLHMTVSVYQRTSYADLLEHGLKAAIKIATEEDPEYRKGLPINYLKHVGAVNSESVSQIRNSIIQTINHLTEKLVNYIPIDAAADQLGKQFMWDALPPVLSKQEKECSVHGNGEQLKKGTVSNRVEIDLDVDIRLIRYYGLRLVMEEDAKINVYYSVENAKVYHDEEMQYLEIQENYAPAIEHLLLNYPFFVKVSELPFEDDTTKVEFVTIFWERGLLVTSKPLPSVE